MSTWGRLDPLLPPPLLAAVEESPMSQGAGSIPDLEKRRASLLRDLADAKVELVEVNGAMNRYEKFVEVPRLMEEIRRIERNLEEIENA